MGYCIELENQVAIVTGAVSGIGAGIALKLAKAGADIAIVDIKEKATEEQVIKEIEALGKNAMYIQADLSIEGNGTKVVQDVVARFGRIDIVVNNAALPSEDWHKAINVNVISPLELIEESAKDMEMRNYGRVINITSSSVNSGGTPIPQYVSTKGALDAMTRFLAKRYAPKGILINSVAPGPVLTDMIQKRYTPQQFSEHYIHQMPINRYLVPDDIAGAVLFLASDLCSAMCGENLLCDGGRVRLGVK